MAQYKDKKLFVFDLDSTLAPSKSPMDAEMSVILNQLLSAGKSISVISGGGLPQYKHQFLEVLKVPRESLANVYLFPTCGAAFYKYQDKNWQLVYEERLTEGERNKIFSAFDAAFVDAAYVHPERLYGEVLEYRGTQVTFSALGQQAPLQEKHAWDPTREKRLKLQAAVAKYLTGFDVKLGGSTSLDVTRRGVDKAYGIAQMEKYLGFQKDEMLFFGDAVFPGGNDYPVKLAGVETIAVSGPADTKKHLRAYLQSS
jgi:HAD superfamily hydrolase (TIGR01484 family)